MGIVDIIVFFAFIACVMFVSLWKSGGEAGKSADAAASPGGSSASL